MAYAINTGIAVSIDGTTWHKLTDHNRKEINVTPDLIQNEQRMANGRMRKFITAKKHKISTNWSYVPTKTELTVDGFKGGAWLDSFYSSSAGVPIYVKVTSSSLDDPANSQTAPLDSTFKTSQNTYQIYRVFMTDFNNTIIHRTTDCDYVTMNVEFTEI
jgi:CRISPR/Cas system endoribonuclease Cas6 (RAMP superfamily)